MVTDLSLERAMLQDVLQLHHNEQPHSPIGNTTPLEFMKSIGATCRPMA